MSTDDNDYTACAHLPPAKCIFFRGAGDWSVDYGANVLLQNKLVDAMPHLNWSMEFPQPHVLWDRKEVFGWLKRKIRRRKLKRLIKQERERTRDLQNEDRPMESIDGLSDAASDVIDFILRPGIAGDYAEAVRQLALSHARMIKSKDPEEFIVVMGHSLGTTGAFLFMRYLMDCFTFAEWRGYCMEERLRLVLVSPAMGFSVVRNKVARYLPRSFDPKKKSFETRIIVGADDFLYKLPTFKAHNGPMWSPSLTTSTHTFHKAQGYGHNFIELLELDNDVWRMI